MPLAFLLLLLLLQGCVPGERLGLVEEKDHFPLSIPCCLFLLHYLNVLWVGLNGRSLPETSENAPPTNIWPQAELSQAKM